jgi:hypothetical protein
VPSATSLKRVPIVSRVIRTVVFIYAP